MPKPIAIEAVIIGSVHLCRSEKSERKRNAGIAQVIYLATLIGQSLVDEENGWRQVKKDLLVEANAHRDELGF